jgi:hypothetical protein
VQLVHNNIAIILTVQTFFELANNVSYTFFFTSSLPFQASGYCEKSCTLYPRAILCETFQADCILLCYSVKSCSSFKSVYKKWCLEVRKHAPLVPIILIGKCPSSRIRVYGKFNFIAATDTEARSAAAAAATVSTEQGENLKLLIGAYAFIECSVEHFLGIDDIFIEAVRSTYQRTKF